MATSLSEAMMTDADADDFLILEQVASQSSISLEDLQQGCHRHSWNRLFSAVDRLSRKGSLVIRRIDRRAYIMSLGRPFPNAAAGTQPI